MENYSGGHVVRTGSLLVMDSAIFIKWELCFVEHTKSAYLHESLFIVLQCVDAPL